MSEYAEGPHFRLAEVFLSLSPAWRRVIEAQMRGTGSTSARMRLLRALNNRGSLIMSELSTIMDVRPRSVTALVDALESDGLVRRSAHETDRRATVIELTPAGQALYRRLHVEHAKGASVIFSHLSESEANELLRLLESVLIKVRSIDQE